MPTLRDIDDQRERLDQHRQNVQILLRQIAAQGGWIHAPLAQINTLIESRAEIARCKAALRVLGAPAEDHPDDSAADALRDLDRQIDELEASLRIPLPEAARQSLHQTLQAAQERRAALVSANVSIGGQATVHGPVVGVNLGTVVYGRDPTEDERRRLVWYLEGLASKLRVLPLRGLAPNLDRGQGLTMPQVYVALATEGRVVVARGTEQELGGFFQRDQLRQEYDPDYALPDQAIIGTSRIERLDPPDRQRPAVRVLERALLASEAVRGQPRLVLLGAPGSGKSTFVRYLAWAVALRELDPAGAPALLGWENVPALLPVILPLRTLAARLAKAGLSDATCLAALRDELHACCTHQIDDALSAALSRGSVLLLFDGLDEVPLQGAPGVADRRATLRAVREFARRYDKCPAVLTCRTRAFDDAPRAELGWHVETLAPFTLGQIRHFVPAWQRELIASGQLDQAQADRLSALLIEAVSDRARPRLREMAQTPLLLTLMALVLVDRGELPRDRPQLYERVLDLLLGQWDQVRDGQALGEALGLPGWDSGYIRPLLDRLSYEAHAAASSEDGRGRLARGDLYKALIDFFKRADVASPGDAALRCLDYFEQRSGLLVPDGPESFVFAHLTLQEHCAGRQIVLNTDDPITAVLNHRADDRWREPIMLGLGLARPGDMDRLLFELIDREEQGAPKPVERWQRDLILAAEIGADRDWTYLRTRPMVRVDKLQQALRRDLALLLSDVAQPLPARERVRAGFLLGDLGDPRFPVTREEWRREWERAQAGDTSGYFCRVAPGAYWIGSADDPDAGENGKPRHHVIFKQPFWIGRFPITNAQWQVRTDADGEESAYADGTDLINPNQPVVGISWDQAVAFCAWLSAQLGVDVRLPREAEWEAAVRSLDGWRYPWGDEWIEDRAATAEDQETRGWEWSVPVGCYPAGAAGCGALDLAGNVWEWTEDVWQSYPNAGKPFTYEDIRAAPGRSYFDDRTNVCYESQLRNHLVGGEYPNGLRVLLAPSVR